jgi:hypothetical protein
MFDSDDLEDGSIFVLLTAERAYVWLGAEIPEGTVDGHALGRECLAARGGASALRLKASPSELPVAVVRQGAEEEEEEGFWGTEYWPNG